MTRPIIRAITLTVLISISALAQATRANAPPPAATTEYDKVHPCDESAANPDDPQRMTTGVAAARIVPRVSLQQCQAAVLAYPATARFQYQLGRALDASDRSEEAVAAYRKAASMGYAMALFDLGVAYGEGRGVVKDETQASQYFRQAQTAGIKAAGAELLRYTFVSEGYSNPRGSSGTSTRGIWLVTTRE